jgi:hypothetical protein
MPRRNNPWTTLFMFLAVVGFGWVSYHFIVEEQIFRSGEAAVPPADKMNKVRDAVEKALADRECFQAITLFEWRERQGHYRVDITILDGCRNEAKSIAQRTVEVVRRASDGSEAHVFVYILGIEVFHLVP